MGQSKLYNFSPGPAILPRVVLEQGQEALLSLPGLGLSVAEISHRSPAYVAIEAEARANIEALLGVPSGYRVLFMQGGARQHFAMIPMNFLRAHEHAAYIVTGGWGEKAAAEAVPYGETREVWSGKANNYRCLPETGSFEVDAGARYAHFCYNETVHGVEFKTEPDVGKVPLICDASSMIMSKPMDVSRYALIYAGAQKNLGIAGLTVVIVRESFAESSREDLPGMLNYGVWSRARSPLNTPPVFAVYMTVLVTRWLKKKFGSLEAVQQYNQQKADLVYAAIDSSDGFYKGTAEHEARSTINVTWRLPNVALEAEFVAKAEAKGLLSLKGYKSVGGIRASLYNAMSVDGAEALAQFMNDFHRTH